MYIERLTLKNFKSFGGSHDLPFDKGFTAIVGPNGSGKSNILDGLRWVLGESGAGRLRVPRQADLIFQGSAGLSEAVDAEVQLSLVAENGARGVLRRRLDASGGVVYINEKRSRIQDLAQFKSQWHLEGDRSAFIGQGEVGAAVLQKPFQRRLQLEELFGVDLYRKKRDNAIDELKQSNEELIRLQALMSELQARRDIIAPELQNARKAKDFQDRLETLKKTLYFCKRHLEEQRYLSFQKKHALAAARLEPAEKWAKAWQNALDELKKRGSDYAKQRSELRDDLDELIPRLNDVLRRQDLIASEKSENDYALRSYTDENDRLAIRLKEEEKNRSTIAVEAGKLKQELASVVSQIHDLEDRLSRRDEKLEAVRKRRQELIDLEASFLEASRQQNARAEALAMQGKERTSLIEALRSKRESLALSLSDADNALEALEDEVERLQEEKSKLAARSQEEAIAAQNLRRAIARAEGELDVLTQKAEAGLYPKAVQTVISAANLRRINLTTIPAVEAFKCPPELAVSLDAYLGGRQYWLLVDSMAQAKIGIELLRRTGRGRATFLPLERCKARRALKLPSDPNVLGWAVDLVIPNERWRPAVEHLLGDLLVVKDYETGSKISHSARFPIVTIDGDVFSPTGTVSGGKTANAGGVISLRTQIENIENNIARDRKAQKEVAKKLEAAEAAEERVSSRLEEKRAAAAEQKSKTDALRRDLRDQNDELNLILQEDSNASARIDQCLAQSKKSKAAADSARAELDSLPLIDEDETENKELSELRTKSLVMNERLTAKQTELEKSIHSVSSLRKSMTDNSMQLRRLNKRLSEIDLKSQEVAAEKKEREDEKRGLEARIAELDKHNAYAARRMERLLLRTQKAAAAYDNRCRDEAAAALDEANSKERLSNLILTNEEKYQYPPDFVPSGDSIEKIEASCRYIERSLRELGEVNLGALSEDKSLQERLSYYGDQTEDVQKGIDKLRGVIATTDKQAENIFQNALLKIDNRFDELFQRLFGGGEAHLRAQEGVPLWDAGVEIIARPPGKKSLFLAQLSGGEQSLTALSLLFASMEVARVPMAVLDEVDAALDEANLTRFALMVAEYSKNIQVIAMTHRRQTMEHADVMYGVTMSEPGLSQIVSVKVDQWT